MILRHIQWWIALIVLVALLGYTMGAMHARAQSDDGLATLRAQISTLSSQGKYTDAISQAQRYVALARQKYGEEHIEYAAAISSLANVYQTLGRYAEAELLFKRSLAIIE